MGQKRKFLKRELTSGLVICLVAVAVFLAIVWQIQGGANLTELDTPLLLALHERARESPFEVIVFQAITIVGSAKFIAVVALVGLLYFAHRRSIRLACVWLIVLLGGALIDLGLKNSFQRERPRLSDPVAVEQSFSFPSGHALGSIVCYGFIAYLLASHPSPSRTRWAGAVALALLVLAVGFSRLFLGVHYLTDVLGAYAAGTAWLAGCIYALNVSARCL